MDIIIVCNIKKIGVAETPIYNFEKYKYLIFTIK